MSIFVNEEETFPIEFYYTEDRDEAGNKISMTVYNEPGEGRGKIEAWFIQPSGDVFGEILEKSTIVHHINHRPVLRTQVFKKNVLLRLMKKCEDNGQEIAIDPKTIAKLHMKISNALFVRYLKKAKLMDALAAVIKDNKLVAEAPKGE